MTNTLVIFGGSGFIGKSLCKVALKQGYHIYSISSHGKPVINEPWINDQNIHWISCDVLNKDAWKEKIPDNIDYCINLIAILKETNHQTYINSIIQPNQLISSWAMENNIPYLFLSARFGPYGYIRAKKNAEKYIVKHNQQAIIIYCGLVTSKSHLQKSLTGSLLQIGSKLPILSHWCKKVYPIDVNKLTECILYIIKSPTQSTKFVDLTR